MKRCEDCDTKLFTFKKDKFLCSLCETKRRVKEELIDWFMEKGLTYKEAERKAEKQIWKWEFERYERLKARSPI